MRVEKFKNKKYLVVLEIVYFGLKIHIFLILTFTYFDKGLAIEFFVS